MSWLASLFQGPQGPATSSDAPMEVDPVEPQLGSAGSQAGPIEPQLASENTLESATSAHQEPGQHVASVAAVDKEEFEEVKCAICLEVLVWPLQMTMCPHMICTKCFQEERMRKTDDVIRCVVCRKHSGNPNPVPAPIHRQIQKVLASLPREDQELHKQRTAKERPGSTIKEEQKDDTEADEQSLVRAIVASGGTAYKCGAMGCGQLFQVGGRGTGGSCSQPTQAASCPACGSRIGQGGRNEPVRLHPEQVAVIKAWWQLGDISNSQQVRCILQRPPAGQSQGNATDFHIHIPQISQVVQILEAHRKRYSFPRVLVWGSDPVPPIREEFLRCMEKVLDAEVVEAKRILAEVNGAKDKVEQLHDGLRIRVTGTFMKDELCKLLAEAQMQNREGDEKGHPCIISGRSHIINRLCELVRADSHCIGCLSSWPVDAFDSSWLADPQWLADPTARIIDILNEVRVAMNKAFVGASCARLKYLGSTSAYKYLDSEVLSHALNDNLENCPYFLHDEVTNTQAQHGGQAGSSNSLPELKVCLSLKVSTITRNHAVFCKDDLASQGPMLLQMLPEPLQWETQLQPLHVSCNGEDSTRKLDLIMQKALGEFTEYPLRAIVHPPLASNVRFKTLPCRLPYEFILEAEGRRSINAFAAKFEDARCWPPRDAPKLAHFLFATDDHDLPVALPRAAGSSVDSSCRQRLKGHSPQDATAFAIVAPASRYIRFKMPAAGWLGPTGTRTLANMLQPGTEVTLDLDAGEAVVGHLVLKLPQCNATHNGSNVKKERLNECIQLGNLSRGLDNEGLLDDETKQQVHALLQAADEAQEFADTRTVELVHTTVRVELQTSNDREEPHKCVMNLFRPFKPLYAKMHQYEHELTPSFSLWRAVLLAEKRLGKCAPQPARALKKVKQVLPGIALDEEWETAKHAKMLLDSCTAKRLSDRICELKRFLINPSGTPCRAVLRELAGLDAFVVLARVARAAAEAHQSLLNGDESSRKLLLQIVERVLDCTNLFLENDVLGRRKICANEEEASAVSIASELRGGRDNLQEELTTLESELKEANGAGQTDLTVRVDAARAPLSEMMERLSKIEEKAEALRRDRERCCSTEGTSAAAAEVFVKNGILVALKVALSKKTIWRESLTAAKLSYRLLFLSSFTPWTHQRISSELKEVLEAHSTILQSLEGEISVDGRKAKRCSVFAEQALGLMAVNVTERASVADAEDTVAAENKSVAANPTEAPYAAAVALQERLPDKRSQTDLEEPDQKTPSPAKRRRKIRPGDEQPSGSIAEAQ